MVQPAAVILQSLHALDESGLGERQQGRDGPRVEAERLRHLQQRAVIEADDLPEAGDTHLSLTAFDESEHLDAIEGQRPVSFEGAELSVLSRRASGTGEPFRFAFSAVVEASTEAPFGVGPDAFPSVTNRS